MGCLCPRSWPRWLISLAPNLCIWFPSEKMKSPKVWYTFLKHRVQFTLQNPLGLRSQTTVDHSLKTSWYSYLPWQVDCTLQGAPEKGVESLWEVRDEPPLKDGVGGKTREPPHNCRSCQKSLLTEHTSCPTHTTVTEPCLPGLTAGARGESSWPSSVAPLPSHESGQAELKQACHLALGTFFPPWSRFPLSRVLREFGSVSGVDGHKQYGRHSPLNGSPRGTPTWSWASQLWSKKAENK